MTEYEKQAREIVAFEEEARRFALFSDNLISFISRRCDFLDCQGKYYTTITAVDADHTGKLNVCEKHLEMMDKHREAIL